ncbi:hypothetical protein Tco_1310056 [Tanacetum coccineum]
MQWWISTSDIFYGFVVSRITCNGALGPKESSSFRVLVFEALMQRNYCEAKPVFEGLIPSGNLAGDMLGLKLFLMLFGVTAALIDVNVAQSKLVLLENFNENYSKCLLLLEEVTTAR